MEENERILEARKKKLKEIFVGKGLWIILALIVLIILGVYIRSLPMQIRSDTGKPGLWDITTNDWTLGPDLDPFLFLRYAKTMIGQGSLPLIDSMRNVPLGFETSTELQMVSYMIVLTYKIVNLFGSYSVNYAGVLMPVIFFALTIISFFLFVREIFLRKDSEDKNLKANIIATISTLFMIVTPIFLSRTIAGIPEKESVGFFFMFLAFYLFLKAWKAKKVKNAAILGTLSGIATALMGLSWGGVSYIYTTIAIASFSAFILNKFHKKETLVYSLWILVSFLMLILLTNRFSISGFLTSLDTGLALVLLITLLVHTILWKTRLANVKFLRESKLPRNILSLIICIILAILFSAVLFGPGFIIEKIKAINQMMFRPIQGRWVTTVAENKQPYFNEWAGSFGPFIKNIPVLFWLFFIGSVVLFKKMLATIKNKDAWILTGLYVLFFFGLVFSRYSSTSVFNGENFISRLFYYGSALILIGSMLYYYNRYHKENNDGFEKINYESVFLLVLLVLCLFTARSAVRLIMVLGPIAPIFLAYLLLESIAIFRKTSDDTLKIVFGIVAIVLLAASIFIFLNYYSTIKNEARGYIPYDYSQQWQKAMAWVRNETPVNAVFAHWWDYGYWVQSIGNRATVTDGGNAIVWWNYLTGRLVLTGDNEKEALEFLYNHNATHLLIDSTDLGKYGAFSQIGSDKDFDRLSSGPATLLSDVKAMKETKDAIAREYNIPAGDGRIAVSPIEEDIIFENNGSKIKLLKEKSGLIGIVITFSQNNDSILFKKAEAAFISNNNQQPILIPMRYIYYNSKIIDFKSGLEATAYLIPRVSQSSVDNFGAALYVSPRLMRGMLSQVYLLNDALNNFKHFKLAHTELSMSIARINEQGYNLNEFTYIDGRGLEGPIKIWEIKYSGNEKVNPEYLRTTPSESIDWKF